MFSKAQKHFLKVWWNIQQAEYHNCVSQIITEYSQDLEKVHLTHAQKRFIESIIPSEVIGDVYGESYFREGVGGWEVEPSEKRSAFALKNKGFLDIEIVQGGEYFCWLTNLGYYWGYTQTLKR